ncbi:hypothetical protein BRADI_3g19880v3 [Brachypodium distachyon]|uniref:DDT domain-containing protein n=1 Tax=Brachypodium distachyon TaxID=15368 RepID=A0A0Q3FCM4_BRADI|nr:hypothetical protein BRADI_3g19880v3 [Brachypodium distachyon]
MLTSSFQECKKSVTSTPDFLFIKSSVSSKAPFCCPTRNFLSPSPSPLHPTRSPVLELLPESPMEPERNPAPEEFIAGGEKMVVPEGSGAGAVVGVTAETDGVGAQEVAAGPEIQDYLWSCHQCRQMKQDNPVTCKTVGKPCPMKYCERCLLTRYGEIAAEVGEKENWKCPKCVGDCNCSNCMVKRGELPTGKLYRAAKASGCSSVRELLNKGKEAVADALKLIGTEKGNPKKALRTDDHVVELPVEIVLPRGTVLTRIAGVELRPEDVGCAIQFLEFCRFFGEIFQIRKEQAEQILKDITGDFEDRVVPSLVANLHISLFYVIQEHNKEKSLIYSEDGDRWIIDIGNYFSESTLNSMELPLGCLKQGLLAYINLSSSSKLDVLNALCDETLSSVNLRNLIVEQVERVDERKCEARKKICTATKQENELKKFKSGMDKKMALEGGESANNEESNNIISQINEAKEIKQAELNELQDVPRTKLIMVDNAVAYWKLDGYCDKNTSIMCQELDGQNTMMNKGKWFMFTEDEQKVVEDCVTTRLQRKRKNRTQV